MVDAVNQAPQAQPAGSVKTGFGSLGQNDFLKLLIVQMQQQDPFDPVDNKEMLAQMAQFSSLSGMTEMGATLTSIAEKLDTLIAMQQPRPAPTAPAEPETQA